MSLLSDDFERAGDVWETGKPIETIVSDIQGTLLTSAGPNRDLEKFLVWAINKKIDVRLASSDPVGSEQDMQCSSLDPVLKALPISEKGPTLKECCRKACLGIDDQEEIPEAFGAVATVNPTKPEARQYFAAQTYKFAA